MRRFMLAFLLSIVLITPAVAIPRALWGGMDWSGITPIAQDLRGDQEFGKVDLKALYMTHDANNLYIKVDHYTPVDKGASYEFDLHLIDEEEDIIGFATNFFPRGSLRWFETGKGGGPDAFPRISANSLGAVIMSQGNEVQIRIPLNMTRGHYRFRVQLTVWPSGDHERGADRMDEPDWAEYPIGGGEATPITPSLLPTPVPTATPEPRWQGEGWQGVTPLASDPRGDHDLGTDLSALLVKEDTDYIFIKVELHTDSNNPAHIYELLFDTDGDTRTDYAANIQLDQKFHVYQHSPAFKELSSDDVALVYGRNWMQVRIPKALGITGARTAVRVWPAGRESSTPGDTLYEPGWPAPDGETPATGGTSLVGIVAVVSLVAVVALMLGRSSSQGP